MMPALALLLLSQLLTLNDVKPYGCRVAGEHEHTAWDHILIQRVYPKKLAIVHGVVLAPGTGTAPMEDVLVELYDQPEIALTAKTSSDREKQKRLAACVTGKDGKFSFDPRPGKYELRLSKHNEWRCTSIIIEVSETADRKTRLTVQMEVAT
jgi:hypothetical protein